MFVAVARVLFENCCHDHLKLSNQKVTQRTCSCLDEFVWLVPVDRLLFELFSCCEGVMRG